MAELEIKLMAMRYIYQNISRGQAFQKRPLLLMCTVFVATAELIVNKILTAVTAAQTNKF